LFGAHLVAVELSRTEHGGACAHFGPSHRIVTIADFAEVSAAL
jgi:hypothetical protein